MKGLKKYMGIAMMVVGVAMLVALHLLHLTFVNMFLIIPLVVILAGAVIYVIALKRESSY
ncbi:MAG: hypothetical protein K5683_06380 [Prevotella sp.]|nr:hypothetical protein [Prevotella sp.]